MRKAVQIVRAASANPYSSPNGQHRDQLGRNRSSFERFDDESGMVMTSVIGLMHQSGTTDLQRYGNIAEVPTSVTKSDSATLIAGANFKSRGCANTIKTG